MLFADADHAQGCARREIHERHDGVRDLCAAIHREAGHAVQTETEVPGVLSISKKEPIRADVLVREAPPATWSCAEIKVRHLFRGDGDLSIPRADQVDEMLVARECDVYAKYRPVRVRPWVFTTYGRPGEAVAQDLRRLARLRLRRSDACRAVSAPSVMQHLLYRWRAELSCTLMMGDARVYLACLGGTHGERVHYRPEGVSVYALGAAGFGY
eukprot:gene19412-biopygen17408